jgi:hypothetical protein
MAGDFSDDETKRMIPGGAVLQQVCRFVYRQQVGSK